MTTLYIRQPARAHAASQPQLSFALAQDNGQVQREGRERLANLAGLIQSANRVVLLLAASDVCLLRCKLPQLPAAKLRLALPNLVEEQMLGNPAEQIVQALPGGADADGTHLLAVVNRPWLTALQEQYRALGAHRISALPSQLCTGSQAQAVLVEQDDNQAELTLIRSDSPAFGFGLLADSPAQLLQDVLQTVRQLMPPPAQLIVAEGALHDWQQVLGNDSGWQLQADSWARRIAAARTCKLDLMSSVISTGGSMLWKQWRWPLVLLGLTALIHLIAINVLYLRDKREADQLRQNINQAFQTAFPKEPVQDAMLQMKQKVAAAKIAAGQSAPDDFVQMSAALGDVYNALAASRKLAAMATIDYRERTLSVKWKDDGELPEADFKTALAARHLTLNANGRLWEIRLQK